MPTCGYCQHTLTACPRGRDCPGPYAPTPCTDCHHGLVCPTHGTRWPAGHRHPGAPTHRNATS